MIKSIKVKKITIGHAEGGRETYYDFKDRVVEVGDAAIRVSMNTIYGPEDLFFRLQKNVDNFLGKNL
jgi:hypothetical protein